MKIPVGIDEQRKHAGRLIARWKLPLAAGASMFIPVKLWDLAVERELSQQAIRQVCQSRGYRPTHGEVAACSSAIFHALTRGYRASWVVNAVAIAGYVGAPAALSAVLATLTSQLTQRVVDTHLQDHSGLAGLDEQNARRLIALELRSIIARDSQKTFSSVNR